VITVKMSLSLNGKIYQVVVRQDETRQSYNVHYMVSLSGSPFFMYKLSVLKSVVKERDIQEPVEWVRRLGMDYIKNMIEQEDFSRSNGVISVMDGNTPDWRTLPPVG
jgi:hypothetical protein